MKNDLLNTLSAWENLLSEDDLWELLLITIVMAKLRARH